MIHNIQISSPIFQVYDIFQGNTKYYIKLKLPACKFKVQCPFEIVKHIMCILQIRIQFHVSFVLTTLKCIYEDIIMRSM